VLTYLLFNILDKNTISEYTTQQGHGYCEPPLTGTPRRRRLCVVQVVLTARMRSSRYIIIIKTGNVTTYIGMLA